MTFISIAGIFPKFKDIIGNCFLSLLVLFDRSSSQVFMRMSLD